MGESAGASVDGAIVGTSVGAHCRREDTIAEAVRDVLSEEGVGAIGRAVQERLCEDGITISERQAYRYVKRYREGGRKALEDARRLPRAKSFVSVDRRLFEIVEGELASQLHKSSGTRGRAIDRVRWRRCPRVLFRCSKVMTACTASPDRAGTPSMCTAFLCSQAGFPIRSAQLCVFQAGARQPRITR